MPREILICLIPKFNQSLTCSLAYKPMKTIRFLNRTIDNADLSNSHLIRHHKSPSGRYTHTGHSPPRDRRTVFPSEILERTTHSAVPHTARGRHTALSSLYLRAAVRYVLCTASHHPQIQYLTSTIWKSTLIHQVLVLEMVRVIVY